MVRAGLQKMVELSLRLGMTGPGGRVIEGPEEKQKLEPLIFWS